MGEALPSTTSAGSYLPLFSRFARVGSEEARSVALALASVRRTNWTCSFPASKRGEDYLSFPQRALFDKIGIRTMVIETDPCWEAIATGALQRVGPPGRRRDFQRQYDLNPARCQRMTVSGLTIASALRGIWHPTRRSIALKASLFLRCSRWMLS